jgi:hypothetical protein
MAKKSKQEYFPLKRREGDIGTPRALLPKGSAEWAYRTLSRLKWALEQCKVTEDEFDKILGELDQYQVWKIIPPEKPYGSREKMIEAELGGREDDLRAKVQELAQTATPAPTKEDHPGGRGKKSASNGSTFDRESTNSSASLTARIARDRPNPGRQSRWQGEEKCYQ